jgi:hypothetical protein
MAVSSSDGSGGATLSNYQHWVQIGSVTYSCYEGSLNSAQIAANVAGQINATDPNCTATVGGQYNNEILITLKAGVAGPIAVSSSDGSAAASLTQGTECRDHPEQHRQPDQRNELGAERPRRARRRRGVAEPVGDHGHAGRRRQHGGVLPDRQQQQQPSVLHRDQLEPVRRLIGQRVVARAHRFHGARLEQRGQGLVDHRSGAPEQPGVPVH